MSVVCGSHCGSVITHPHESPEIGCKGEETITVEEILCDESLQDENNYVQVSRIIDSDLSSFLNK